jgi:phospholipid-binding lipoprotein MlaA
MLQSLASTRRLGVLLILWFSITVLGGCAAQPATYADEPDPWEGMNRGIFAFNRGLDKVIIRPAAKGYTHVLPQPARRGVTNFFNNLEEPFNAINSLLQGKPGLAGNAVGRFAINTTVGLLGLMDVAAHSGVKDEDGRERGLRRHEEDFGQTLAVWGVPGGPYLMLPLLGPSSARDVFSTVQRFFSPLRYISSSEARRPLIAVRILDARSRFLSLDDTINASADPYLFVRNGYIQNRTFAIFDGNPPIENMYDDYDLDMDE